LTNYGRYSWEMASDVGHDVSFVNTEETGHIKNDAPINSSIVACVFVTAVKFLPSRCLAMIGRVFRAVA
jgi:hypothetical protein